MDRCVGDPSSTGPTLSKAWLSDAGVGRCMGDLSTIIFENSKNTRTVDLNQSRNLR